MGETTGIGWTESTWNPLVGCTQVSPGCAKCYAKTLHDKRHKAFRAGKMQNVPQYAAPFEVVQTFHERLEIPLRWRRPRRIFANSLSDLFHYDVPVEFIAQVFAVMACAEWHTFQVLTKRARRMYDVLTSEEFAEAYADMLEVWEEETEEILESRGEFSVLDRRTDDFRTRARELPLPNVWLGVSVENQRLAEERVPLLLRTPAACRFLSVEPLLGKVDLRSIVARDDSDSYDYLDGLTGDRMALTTGPDDVALFGGHWPRMDWVIVGGESGPGARPMEIEWARTLRDQCSAAGVAYFLKQLGGHPDARAHEKAILDGRTHTDFPRAA